MLARHAWRCYLNRPDVNTDRMSKPSYAAWIACDTVWDRLRPSEQDIVKAFHSIPAGYGQHTAANGTLTSFDQALKTMASVRHISIDYVWTVVRKAYRMWAIERGLADE